jgi:hypothetical protein
MQLVLRGITDVSGIGSRILKMFAKNFVSCFYPKPQKQPELSLILQCIFLIFYYSSSSRLPLAARWIRSTRIFQRHSIECVIVYFWTRCLVILSLPTVSGCILNF